MATLKNLILESIDDELRKFQHQNFDNHTNWKFGIDISNFRLNVQSRINPGDAYYFVEYKEAGKYLDSSSEILKVFKSIQDVKQFINSISDKNLKKILSVEYLPIDAFNKLFPINSKFDKILIEMNLKGRFDTFTVSDSKSYSKFIELYEKFSKISKITILRISGRKDITSKF